MEEPRFEDSENERLSTLAETERLSTLAGKRFKKMDSEDEPSAKRRSGRPRLSDTILR